MKILQELREIKCCMLNLTVVLEVCGRFKKVCDPPIKPGESCRSPCTCCVFVCVQSGPADQRVTGSTMSNVVQRVHVALGERGDRLTRAEDKTVELMHKAQQFADTAHKVTRNADALDE